MNTFSRDDGLQFRSCVSLLYRFFSLSLSAFHFNFHSIQMHISKKPLWRWYVCFQIILVNRHYGFIFFTYKDLLSVCGTCRWIGTAMSSDANYSLIYKLTEVHVLTLSFAIGSHTVYAFWSFRHRQLPWRRWSYEWVYARTRARRLLEY